MKQGNSYFTVILWILLAAIAAYFGYHVISSLYAPLMTATVTPYEAGAGYYASGFVVREEELLYSQYGTTVLSCAEGAHVAANDTVATGYRSADARLRQTRMDELSGQIEQLQSAWRAVSSVYDQAALDTVIAYALAQLSRYLALRDMNSVSDLSPELKGLILRRTGSGADSGTLQSRINALQAELDTLAAQSAGDTSAISAGRAGTFSAAVDGYEAVLTPERLMDMTVAEFEAVQPDEADAHAIGRLITSTTWYYACVVPASELSDVEEGDRATLTFARDYYQPVTMRVERLTGHCRTYHSCGSSRRRLSSRPTPGCASRSPPSVSKTVRLACISSKGRSPSGSPSPFSTIPAKARSSRSTPARPTTSGRATS